jgi:hypothetical protein
MQVLVIQSSSWAFKRYSIDGPSNGLPISRAALIDREGIVADSNAQNRPDLVAASGVGYNHPSDRPYVGTAETALTIASSAIMAVRQSSDPNTHWCA